MLQPAAAKNHATASMAKHDVSHRTTNKQKWMNFETHVT
jgi:fatty acid desaturase